MVVIFAETKYQNFNKILRTLKNSKVKNIKGTVQLIKNISMWDIYYGGV